MDSDIWRYIVILFLLSLGAAYCASSEISYSRVNQIRLTAKAKSGSKKAEKALEISENYAYALTTLLIGNNLTHIFFASVATLLVTRLWGAEVVKYSTILISIYVFLFTELLPKSYGKHNAEKLALSVSSSLGILMTLLKPAVFLFSSLSDYVLSKLPEQDPESVSEDEFLDIIETAEREGSIDEQDKGLMTSAIKFENLTVGDSYIPLSETVSISVDADNKSVYKIIDENKFSRIPVYRGAKYNFIGIINSSSFLKEYILDKTYDFKKLITKTKVVSTDVLINDLIAVMSAQRMHLMAVEDNEKKIVGIITLEDILEELLGEIYDENDVCETLNIDKGREKCIS